MRILANFILFQMAWFACVLGAGQGNFWLGPVAVLMAVGVHLALCANRRAEVLILGVVGAIGFAVDSVLTALGVYSPARQYMPAPWVPLWLFSMWLNLATLLNVSLRWLHGKYVLSSVLGSIGGAAAYYSGMRLGALSFNTPVTLQLLITGVAWGVVTPILFWSVFRINGLWQE